MIDDETRCEHYHSQLDIIAIKCKYCNTFYPCYQCHQFCKAHEIVRWKSSEWEEKAVLCGHCKKVLSIREYMDTDICIYCGAKFNPKCTNHYHFYFEM